MREMASAFRELFPRMSDKGIDRKVEGAIRRAQRGEPVRQGL